MLEHRSCVGFAGVPTERLLDKYDQTFFRKLYAKEPKERPTECGITKNMNSLNTHVGM